MTEWFFIFAMGLAALFTLLLIGMGVRQMLRGDEGEIGGWEARGMGRRLGAVVRATLAEAVRMRIAVVFIAGIVIAIPIFATQGTGDGTIKGRVQMFIQYSLGFSAFLLAVLTVIVSTRSLSAEIAGRQIFGMVSKPIPRWQIVVGKWLGVTLLNALMLIFATGATYGGVRWLVTTLQSRLRAELVNRSGLTSAQVDAVMESIRKHKGVGGRGVDSPMVTAVADALGWSNDQTAEMLLKLPEQMRAELRRLDAVRRQVLVCRAAVKPPDSDVSAQVQARYAEMEKAGELPRDNDGKPWAEQKILRELTQSFLDQDRRVAPFQTRSWELKGPPPPAESDDFILSVRYKLEGYAPSGPPIEGLPMEENRIYGVWAVGKTSDSAAFYWPPAPESRPVNTVVEFEAPTRCVKPDGTIELFYSNIDPRIVTTVFARDSLEVLYTAGTFEVNLLRGILVMMLPLMAVAAMGVFFSTFCTFPVAALVTLTLFAAASASDFVYEAAGFSAEYFPENPQPADQFRKAVGEGVLGVLTLGHISAPDRLQDGRLMTWPEIAVELRDVFLIKCVLFLVLGIYVFRRRELAAIIV